MAEWFWVESPGARLRAEPRVAKTPFGDGYTQRAADGINTLLQQWDLVFRNVSPEEGDAMCDFLQEHDGRIPFDYWPMRGAAKIKVICESWDRAFTKDFESDITCRFEQVPDL